MTTTIELAKIEDADVLKSISIDAFTSDYEQYGSYPPGIESLAWHQSEIEKGHYYKILFNGELAGGICLIPSENKHIKIEYFFIANDYQNKRIGSTTMELIEKQYSSAITWVLKTPYKAYRNNHFYQKFGYRKIGEFQPDPDKDFILFEYKKEILK